MTTTTAPNAQAWLAKEATSLGPFVVRLDGDRVGFGALAPGHWVVVVNTSEGTRRAYTEYLQKSRDLDKLKKLVGSL